MLFIEEDLHGLHFLLEPLLDVLDLGFHIFDPVVQFALHLFNLRLAL